MGRFTIVGVGTSVGKESAMASHPSLSKSPLAVAKMALRIARAAIPAWSCPKSRHDFTQPQLFALLAVKEFLRTDYRGVVAYLEDWSNLRKILKIKKIPHYTTLQKAQQRLLKKKPFTTCNPACLSTRPC